MPLARISPTAFAIAAVLLCAAVQNAEGGSLDAALDCDRSIGLDPQLVSAANKLGDRTYYDISVSGLSRLTEPQLWFLLGAGEPELNSQLRRAGIDREKAEVLLSRLWKSGLFAEVALEPDNSASKLVLRLSENPLVQSVKIEGLQQSPENILLEQLLGIQTNLDDEPGREAQSMLRFRVWRRRTDAPIEQAGCGPALIDPAWFARVEEGNVQPGILRGGVEVARARALEWLRERGYPHASLTLSLSNGVLTALIDEGHLLSFEVRGVAPELRAEVEATLGFKPGDIFSSVALHQAIERLHARYPYIDLDTEHEIAQTGAQHGRERSLLDRIESGRAEVGEIFFDWSYREGGVPPGADAADRGASLAGNSVEVVSPGHIILWLRESAATVDVDWIQLIRHTPSTGFAPGLAATFHLWDAANRADLSLDGLLAGNTKRASREPVAGSDLLEKMSAREDVDFLAGARLAVPSIQLAEVGAQLYALTDTNDTWRMSDTNSYIHSALLAQPDREYFRRAGATFLATFQLFEQLTLGGEYHLDRYDPLPNPRVWSAVNMDNPPPPTAPVTTGRLGYLLFRAEYSSELVPLLRVGKLARHPETSLADRGDSQPAFTSLLTLDVGDRALGNDVDINRYFHILSDSRLQLSLPHDFLARIRFRAGGGNDLPLQKEEALGGWSALRGYDFKEYRGDSSLLGNIEARWHWAGAFFDLGSVHQSSGWSGVLPAIGAQLFLYKIGSVEVAWRLDGRGNAIPSARALLGWDL